MTKLRFQSIISRILSLHMLAIGVTSIVMPAALYGLLRSAANDLHRGALDEHANTIEKYLSRDQGGNWHLDLPPNLRELYSTSYGRYAYAVVDSSGRLLFSSSPKGKPVLRSDHRLSEPVYFEGQRRGSLIFGASIPKHIGGTPVWVQVSQDPAHRDVLIDNIVDEFFPRVGWIAIPILLLLLVFDILIFRRALRPVVRASEIAGSIAPERTEVRLPASGMPKEILPLINAVNQALDRLEQGFKAQRRFTADAAHELRTPLTILRTRIDTLGSDEARTALKEDVANISRMVSQLLEMAELEHLSVDPGERADLRAVCAEVVSYFAPMALDRQKTIALTGDGTSAFVKGNVEIISHAIRNIVENAIIHSAHGLTVEVEVTSDGVVRVIDDGPGVPEAEWELIFQRFWRQDRQRKGGSGLGLSIASRIVEAYGGSITVENRVGGGAIFTAHFLVEVPQALAGLRPLVPA